MTLIQHAQLAEKLQGSTSANGAEHTTETRPTDTHHGPTLVVRRFSVSQACALYSRSSEVV